MIQLSFPTIKLKSFIRRVNVKVKDTPYKKEDITVYGVTNKEGITTTGNKASEDLSNYLILKENQFAYNPYRINVGSLGLAPQGVIGAVSPAYVVFETSPELNSLFLYYYLKSQLGINLIKWYGDRGGVRSALRYRDLEQIDIPKLSIEEQLHVLGKLKEIRDPLDKLNANLELQKENIIMLRQSILQEAVQGKLVEQDPDDESANVLLEKINDENEQLIKDRKIKNKKGLPQIRDEEIPFELRQGWEWVRVETLGITVTGKTPPTNVKEYYNGEIPFLNPGNINNGKVNYDGKTLTKEGSKFSQVIPKGSILIVCINGSLQNGIGQVAINDREITVNQQINALIPYSSLNSKYILYCFLSSFFQQNVKKGATGTVNYIINKSTFSRLILPLPPLDEQRRIVEKVDQLMALCNKLENTMDQSKKESEMLMQSVLQEAFSNSNIENNLIDFPDLQSDETTDEWDIVARAYEISPETQAEITAVLNEIKKEKQ
jgi:type I restriction enzyme S subunit